MSRILSLDIGGTNFRMAIINNHLDIEEFISLKTSDILNEQDLFSQVSKFRTKDLSIQSLGLSVAGPIKNNSVIFTNASQNFTLHSNIFTNSFGQVFILNDATAAVYGEAKRFSLENVVFITISTGIGVGVLKNGQLVHFSSLSEELGHLQVESDLELKCGCGQQNHWEAFASGQNIPKFFHQWLLGRKLEPDNKYNSSKEIFKLAENGDQLATDFLVNGLGAINSTVLSKIIDFYQPELIIFGGPVALENKKLFLAGITDDIKNKVNINFTERGDKVSLLGMANYVFDHSAENIS